MGISLSASTNELTHGLHRYPAKYIPQIPRWAIREYSSPGETVLDPFSGSGTTLVEALAAGRGCVGVDLDPLACLIAEAKITSFDVASLETSLPTLMRSRGMHQGELITPLPGVANFGHWFTDAAWADLQSLRMAIEAVSTSPQEYKFLLVIFSSILRAVSNADDQSQKTYVSGTLRKTPPSVYESFEKKFRKSLDGVKALNAIPNRGKSAVHRASATSLPVASSSIDMIVTSPPYLDSVDYMYNLMLEYFWLGEYLGVGSRSEFNDLRKGFVGSKSPKNGATLPESIRHLIKPEQLPKYRRDVAAPYFVGMLEHFHEAQRVLKDGGRYVLVVGNSRTQEGMLPIHDGLIALARTAGLQMEHAFGYRIRRHYMKFPRKGRGGIILMDWVITLRKGEPPAGVPHRLPLIDGQLSPDSVAH